VSRMTVYAVMSLGSEDSVPQSPSEGVQSSSGAVSVPTPLVKARVKYALTSSLYSQAQTTHRYTDAQTKYGTRQTSEE
jgi:hypothetical protein